MSAPLITLTTDFGTRDSYVAQMKGELLRLGPPELRVLDLGHEIAPQDVREAALFLRECVPRFPAGTIHVAVVDPGVGSARRAIAREWQGQLLISPDNGVFGWLPQAQANERIHSIAIGGAAAVSSTFHGRDVFAPAAARLAHGVALTALGPALSDPCVLPWPEPAQRGGQLHGEVIHVDRFGNLITNLDRALVGASPAARVALLGREIGPIHDHYAQAQRGALLALFGSSGLLEVAVREGSAARIAGAGLGSPVVVERSPHD